MAHLWIYPLKMVLFHSYVSVFCMFTRGYHIHKNFESQHPILQVSRQSRACWPIAASSAAARRATTSAVAMVMAKHNAPPSNISINIYQLCGECLNKQMPEMKDHETFWNRKAIQLFHSTSSGMTTSHYQTWNISAMQTCEGSIRNIQVDSGRWLCTSWSWCTGADPRSKRILKADIFGLKVKMKLMKSMKSKLI